MSIIKWNHLGISWFLYDWLETCKWHNSFRSLVSESIIRTLVLDKQARYIMISSSKNHQGIEVNSRGYAFSGQYMYILFIITPNSRSEHRIIKINEIISYLLADCFVSHLKDRIVQPPKTAAPTLRQTVACQSCPLKPLFGRPGTPGLKCTSAAAPT